MFGSQTDEAPGTYRCDGGLKVEFTSERGGSETRFPGESTLSGTVGWFESHKSGRSRMYSNSLTREEASGPGSTSL